MDEEKSIEIRESCIIESIDVPGHSVRVTIIKGGKSINGYYYNDDALQSIARMVEGAHAYADHGNSNQSSRSMRDLIGFYKDAQFVPSDGVSLARVDATLHVLSAASWLWDIIQESHTLGKPDLVGLSIDIFGTCEQDTTLNAKVITRVASLNSCDVVTRPSAGGSINRILHDVGSDPQEGNGMDPEKDVSVVDPPATQPITTQTEKNPSVTQVQESQPTTQTVVETTPTKVIATPDLTQIQESQRLIEAQRAEMAKLLEQARLDRAQTLLERKLQESILPQAVRAIVKGRFVGRIFEEAELDKDIQDQLGMLAQLTRDGLVRGHGFDKTEITGSQITEAEKVQAAFDRMFDLDIDAKYGNVRPFTSIREAYARVTGTSSLQSGISSATQLGQIGIHEAAPIERITEVDTTTASFSYLLGTSMNKRLLKDYQTWPAEWMKFVTIAPIRDFKQQSRVRLGAFGSLSTVPENTAYSAVTLTDSAATYVATKRGNLVTVSRETIINDDLHAIRQIPTKLAQAAAYTLAEFVYAFLSGNPAIFDGSLLFTAGAPHTNLGAAALSSASMQSGVTAMRNQTNFAAKRLGLRPRYLIVPPELEFTAMVITKSAGVPGSNNNDINPMLGYVTPIVSAQLTNTTQWYMAGDPREIDTIEVGFVGGQVNPALYVQDSPLLGLNYTQDAISFKCRHEYGGCCVDWRGLYRGL